MAAYEPEQISKPWGGETIFARTDRYVGKILTIKAGEFLSRQYHRVKDETIYVLEGRLGLELGEGEEIERRTLGPGAAFHISPGTIHRFVGDTDVRLAEVSTPETDDVVRLEDRYGREGTSDP